MNEPFWPWTPPTLELSEQVCPPPEPFNPGTIQRCNLHPPTLNPFYHPSNYPGLPPVLDPPNPGSLQPWNPELSNLGALRSCNPLQLKVVSGSRDPELTWRVPRLKGSRVCGFHQGWRVPRLEGSSNEGFQGWRFPGCWQGLGRGGWPHGCPMEGPSCTDRHWATEIWGVLGTKLGTSARRPLGYTGYTGISREKQRWTDLVQKWRDLPPRSGPFS